MNRKRTLFAMACCASFAPWLAVAQGQSPQPPPKVIRIGREDVKPGKEAAHEKMETAWAKAFIDAKVPQGWIGMTPVTGGNEVWYLSGLESLADYEQQQQAMDKMTGARALGDKYGSQESEFLAGIHNIMGTWREDLSYRGDPTPIGKMRYLYITTTRVRPGHEADFVEITKTAKAAHEKAGVPERWAVYEISLGMPRGTFLTVQPLKSLADVDAFPQTHGQAYRDAIGDEGRKKLAELASSGILTAETNIFQFSPAMSIPPKFVADGDPDFWNPKPAKAAPGAKKEAAKPKAQ
jgi:hypothetical protein